VKKGAVRNGGNGTSAPEGVQGAHGRAHVTETVEGEKSKNVPEGKGPPGKEKAKLGTRGQCQQLVSTIRRFIKQKGHNPSTGGTEEGWRWQDDQTWGGKIAQSYLPT